LLQFVSTQIAAAIERKQMAARLQFMALYDQLTALPNRGLFGDRVKSALTRARRNQLQLSLFYLDLDKFKAVNDIFGHTTGDFLLEKVARRLELCVRESDTVARFGGDEFVVLLENIDSHEQSQLIADNIYSALSQPFELACNQVQILPSIGIAHYPLHGSDEAQLLRYADEAMYINKKSK
jgi:diguanylate cyclase (GGDEF)-like protein